MYIPFERIEDMTVEGRYSSATADAPINPFKKNLGALRVISWNEQLLKGFRFQRCTQGRGFVSVPSSDPVHLPGTPGPIHQYSEGKEAGWAPAGAGLIIYCPRIR